MHTSTEMRLLLLEVGRDRSSLLQQRLVYASSSSSGNCSSNSSAPLGRSAAAAHVQIRPPKTALDARTCNHRSSLASNAFFWWGKSKKNSVVFGRIF